MVVTDTQQRFEAVFGRGRGGFSVKESTTALVFDAEHARTLLAHLENVGFSVRPGVFQPLSVYHNSVATGERLRPVCLAPGSHEHIMTAIKIAAALDRAPMNSKLPSQRFVVVIYRDDTGAVIYSADGAVYLDAAGENPVLTAGTWWERKRP